MIRGLLFHLAPVFLVSCFVLAPAGVARADQPPTPRQLVASAAEAMEIEDYDRALDFYAQARDLLPDNAAIPYNMAVAQYRKGDYDRAAQLFNDALTLARDADLRTRSTYNLGNSAYAQSLKTLREQSDPTRAMDNLDNASKKLDEAMRHFRNALDADPDDEDARANAELSHRLLKQLRELQEQLQQQPQQQQQGDQQQQQQQEGDPQQQQQQQQQQQGDQQQQQQQEGDPQQQQQQQQQQPQPPERQDDRQPAQPQGRENESQEEPPPQPQPAQADEEQPDRQEQAAGADERKPMSPEEAQRLLQRVRDKERQRREALAQQQRARHKSAEKDW